MKNFFTSKTYTILQGVLMLAGIYYSYQFALMLFNRLHGHAYLFSDITVLMPFLLVGMMVLFDVFGLYEAGELDGIQLFLSLLLAGIIGNAALVVVAVGFNVFVLPAKLFIYAYGLQIAILLPLLTLRDAIHRRVIPAIKVLLVGSEDELPQIKKLLENKSRNRCRIVASTGSVEQIQEAELQQVDALYMGRLNDRDEERRLVAYALHHDLPIFYDPDILQIGYRRARLVRFDDTLIFRMDNRAMSIEERFVKRLLDLLFATLMLVVLSPLMLLAALAVRVEDKGPAIFSQERVKMDEKTYNLYKFRTMYVDAEKQSGPVLATLSDPRITKVGNFLRKTRIDELPQLFNVLIGDMSLVGPRPERPFFVEEFKKTVPNYQERFRLKPGITGLAQVDGKYSTGVVDKLKFDLLYILNYSLLLDIRILLQTVRTVLLPEQAAGIEEEE